MARRDNSKALIFAPLEKRSLSLAGHRTSLSLEPIFWRLLEERAVLEELSLPGLIAKVDEGRLAAAGPNAKPPNLASALRSYLVAALLAP